MRSLEELFGEFFVASTQLKTISNHVQFQFFINLTNGRLAVEKQGKKVGRCEIISLLSI